MDAMRGDATLFTRDDEVEAQWRIIDPILERLGDRTRRRSPSTRPGSHGPEEADAILAPGPPLAGDLGVRDRARGPRRRRGLVRARTRRRRTSRRRCATCSSSSTPRDGRFAPGAGAQPGRGGRPRVARRDHEPARAGGPLPRLAHDPVRGRAGPRRRSTRSVTMTVGGDAAGRRARARRASACCSTWARSTSRSSTRSSTRSS